MPNDVADLIIQKKKENPKISNKIIAEEVGILERKVNEILKANDLKDLSLEAKKILKKIKNRAHNPKAIQMIETKGIIDDEDLLMQLSKKRSKKTASVLAARTLTNLSQQISAVS